MRLALALILFLGALAGAASAGRNANGALVVHTNDTYNYSAQTACYQLDGGPESCEELNTQAGRQSGQVIWLVCAFPEQSSPGVTVIYFGIDYDDNLDPGAAYRFCGPAGSLEVPDSGWPYEGRGNSVAFGSPVFNHMYPFYVFKVDSYGDGATEWFSTTINPTGGYAAYVDDSNPPVIDECTRFGTIRWGTAGQNDCALDVPAGACCFEDGSCELLTAELCSEAGGTYQGDNTLCSFTDCPVLIGACCLPDGSCAIASQRDCELAGGVYQGNETTCDPDPCLPPEGACCFPDGTCAMYSQERCEVAGGQYQGDGTTCDPNPCPPPVATESTTWGSIKATYR
jgi:hypothetical protein